MQAWLFASCCSLAEELSAVAGRRLSVVAGRRLSARESRNPPLPAPSDQDSAPHPRTFTQRQQLFTVRIPTKGCRPSNPVSTTNQEPCSSLGCRGVIHSKSTPVTPFQRLSLIRHQQGITGGEILKRKPDCRWQLLAKRKPHCRPQLSHKKYFWPQPHNRSEGFEKQQEEQRCARGSLLRARAWRESALHWGTCGSRVAAAAATNTVTSIGAHRCHHHPQCSTTDASEQGPHNLLERNPTTWPRGPMPTCARERHWISLHPAAFSFGRCSHQSIYLNRIGGTNQLSK